MSRYNPANPEIDTSLLVKYLRVGTPSRTNKPANFGLKTVLQDAVMPGDRVHSRTKQIEQYGIAVKDDPGWFMIIQTPGLLDTAKHVAANIVQSYMADDLSTVWLTSFFKDPPPRYNLYVFDALFSDDLTSRRSRIYEVLCGLNNPAASVILLCRSPDIVTAVHQIGLKPHLMLSLTR